MRVPVFQTVYQIFIFSLIYGWFHQPLWLHYYSYLHLTGQRRKTVWDAYPLNLFDLEMVLITLTFASTSCYSVIWSHISISKTWKCGIDMCIIRRNRFFKNVWIASSLCHTKWRNVLLCVSLDFNIPLLAVFPLMDSLTEFISVSLMAFILTGHLDVKKILLKKKTKALKL